MSYQLVIALSHYLSTQKLFSAHQHCSITYHVINFCLSAYHSNVTSKWSHSLSFSSNLSYQGLCHIKAITISVNMSLTTSLVTDKSIYLNKSDNIVCWNNILSIVAAQVLHSTDYLKYTACCIMLLKFQISSNFISNLKLACFLHLQESSIYCLHELRAA